MRSVIDLRSDTATQPTDEMRAAMAKAPVGDAVFCEDPVVNVLEPRVAKLFGMEASLFVPSGTMANLIAIMVHCSQRGSEIIVGDKTHIHVFEQANYAQIAGVGCVSIPNEPDGTIPLDAIKRAIRDHSDQHQAKTQLICLENTHNSCGGRALPLEYLKQVKQLADENDILVHVDGSRIINASIATGHSVAEMMKYAHSSCICSSKALGAPVGSFVVGTKKFIDQATRFRKALGGGMRKPGMLAAGAMIALDTAFERLAIDHKNAKLLAKGIDEIGSKALKVDQSIVDTNIVLLETTLGSNELKRKLEEPDALPSVLVNPLSDSVLRFVTHCGVSEDNIRTVIDKLKKIVL